MQSPQPRPPPLPSAAAPVLPPPAVTPSAASGAASPRPGRRPWTLTVKLGAIGGMLLVLALASIGLTLWVTWQLEGGAAAVNEAGRMRMQTWRMAQTLASGDGERLREQARTFDASLTLLARGDPARPLFVPHDAASRAAFAEVQRGWQALEPRWLGASPPPPALAAVQAEAFVAQVDGFVTAIESQLARWTAVLHAFQLALMGLAIAAAVALLYAAYLFVFNPLTRLQAALARAERGDLAARVEVASDDEFGALAAGFNRMAATLQGLYGNLEAKVTEKTEHLRAERERLQALYEASAFVGRAETLPELARGFARQLRRVAGADAAAVRWSDETNRRYLLAGSDCLPQSLIGDEHCLLAGDCVCGRPAGDTRMQVIPIREARPDGSATHCVAAGFEHLLTVPVRLHDRALGEIDLLYRSEPRLGGEDRALLETLASHLAGALESQRAAALEREAAVAEERSLLARELHDSIAQGLAFLKIQVQLLRDALARGEQTKAERALAELDSGVRESTADVRELLVHFRTRTNSEDIVPALQTTLSKFEHQSGVRAQLAVRGEGLPLPPDTQIQVLHVVQEALSNVRKHAGAQQVWVELQQGPAFSVEVRDDGRGFDDRVAASDETHVGLRIMRERAARIGARVDVCSTPGEGTRVRLSLPAAGTPPPAPAPARALSA
jgi:two-component system nitrate/nitrite sensor histidine kinase NarX